MQIDGFAVLAGALLSLLFAYIPGFKTFYEKLDSDKKQLVMLAAIFVVIAGKYGLGCLGKDTTFVCTPDGAYEALVAFVLAIASNVGVYKGTKYLRSQA